MAKDSSGRGNHLPLITLPTAAHVDIQKVGALAAGGLAAGEGLGGGNCGGLPGHRIHASGAARLPPLLQGGDRLQAGALSFRNNYALQPDYTGMPDK